MLFANNYSVTETTYTNKRGENLDCVLMLPDRASHENPVPIVTTTHGWNGSITRSGHIVHGMPLIANAGAAVFAFNMTGASKDKISTRNLRPQTAEDDIACAMNKMLEMTDHRVDTDKIVPWAVSFGAHAFMRYAVRPDAVKFKHMFMYAPVPNLMRNFEDELKWGFGIKKLMWHMAGKVVRTINNEPTEIGWGLCEDSEKTDIFRDVAPKIPCKVTIAHGLGDELTSPDEVRSLIECMNGDPASDLHMLQTKHVLTSSFAQKRLAALTRLVCRKEFGENFGALPGHKRDVPPHIAFA